MFSKGTTALINRIPKLAELEPDEVRRLLSTAYLDVIAGRSLGTRVGGRNAGFLYDYLRRLANALENHAVFASDVETEVRQASAFVAAEALALLVDLAIQRDTGSAEPYRLADSIIFTRIEAALLYLLAGFDSNARTLVDRILSIPIGGVSTRTVDCAEWALQMICAFCALRTDLLSIQIPSPLTRRELVNDLHNSVRAGMFRELGESVRSCIRWLAGESGDPVNILERLRKMNEAVAKNQMMQHAEFYHLARLVETAFESVSTRALCTLPAPHDAPIGDFLDYLRLRAQAGRLLLWPAVMEYVKNCLPGPKCHAVVAVPTGSGKSFVGELAIAHAALTGWGLYLVPTNALASQVQSELERALKPFGITVRAFLGADEYTTLEEEKIVEDLSKTAVVMTPEKCALALRLSPRAFTSCRAIIFDECHLLADENRGVLAELVLSHVLALAPSCCVVLMSAMVANANEIADWLTGATGVECIVIRVPWRPTQTLRGVVGIDEQKASEEFNLAIKRLNLRSPNRKNEEFDAPHAILANLQGAWVDAGVDDHVLVKLPTATKLKVNRKHEVDFSSWANATLREIVVHLATRKIKVLGFLPGSKHFPFSVGKGIAMDLNGILSCSHSNLVQALLEIARDELGIETAVGELLTNGVAVHSAALLDSERRASELAFANGSAEVMLATGTLAQGLNLPAEAVVIGGTAVGDRREAHMPKGRLRTRVQLLNALGRAGRAGVANHGLGLVITNSPLLFDSPPDIALVRKKVDFLTEEDDSTIVTSRLDAFVNGVLGGHVEIATASPDDLVALSYLSVDASSPIEASQILDRTHAIQRRALRTQSIDSRAVAENLIALSEEFLRSHDAPAWITAVAYRTGLSFLLTLRLVQALGRVVSSSQNDPPTTVTEWLHLLFQVLRLLPADRAKEMLGQKIPSAAIEIFWDTSLSGDDPYWEPPQKWENAWNILESASSMYCHGKQISELAKILFAASDPVDPGRSTGTKPIPRTISFLGLLHQLSRAAGAILAIHEFAGKLTDENERKWCFPLSKVQMGALAALPIAMRCGCGDINALAWYRFGIRFRRPATLLAQQFPLPVEITADSDVRRWIRRTRAKWLKTIPIEEETDVLKATRTILQS